MLRQKRKLLKIGISTLSALLIGGTLFYFSAEIKDRLQASLVASEKPVELGSFPVTIPTIKYGFAIDTFQVLDRAIQSGQFLADILLAQQVDYPSIEQIVANSKDVFDVRHFRVGKPYTILTKDSTQRAEYLIYEPNVYEYIIFELQGSHAVTRHRREVSTETRSAAGRSRPSGSSRCR